MPRHRRSLRSFASASQPPIRNAAPPTILATWLDEHSSIHRVLERLQRDLRHGIITRAAALLALKKWSDTLPPRRGAVKNIRDFMQLKFALDPGLILSMPKRQRRKNRS